MNLTTDTLSILKNFSEINQNILVKPGKKLSTISTMKNILAEAKINPKLLLEQYPCFLLAQYWLNLFFRKSF